MTRSITLFGPSHSGKSTLAGYLYAKTRTGYNLALETRKIEEQYGSAFRMDQKFAYIFNTTRMERLHPRFSRETEMGAIRIGDALVTLIDTPGMSHMQNQRESGIYLGDIGVFVIDIKDVLLSVDSAPNDQDMARRKMFLPLKMWINVFKKPILPIVVLSKVDLVGFDPQLIDEAKLRVAEMLNEDIDVVPISISVREESDFNIFEVPVALTGKGGSLWEVLLRYQDRVLLPAVPTPILVSIVSPHRDIPTDSPAKILRGKILEGNLAEGQTVTVTAVHVEGHFVATVRARIASLMFEKGDVTSRAEKGHIVGIKLTDFTQRGRRLAPRQISFTKSTLLLDAEAEIVEGDLFIFSLSDEPGESLPLLSELTLLWYGNFVPLKIVKHEDKGAILWAEVVNHSLALPLRRDDGEYCHRTFLVRKNISSSTLEEVGQAESKDGPGQYRSEQRFLSVRLIRLAKKRALKVHLPLPSDYSTAKLESILVDYSHVRDGEGFLIEAIPSLFEMLTRLRSVFPPDRGGAHYTIILEETSGV